MREYFRTCAQPPTLSIQGILGCGAGRASGCLPEQKLAPAGVLRKGRGALEFYSCPTVRAEFHAMALSASYIKTIRSQSFRGSSTAALSPKSSNSLLSRRAKAKVLSQGVYDGNLAPGYFLAGGR